MSSSPRQCPMCGAAECRVFLARCRDVLHRTSGEWTLMECTHCAVVFTAPPLQQDELSRYYPEEYVPHHSLGSIRSNPVGALFRFLAVLPYRLRFGKVEWDEPPFGNGRLLDVGCGQGALLKRMNRLGWRCWGIDVSPHAVAETQRNVPEATVFLSDLAHLSTQQSFDVIVMSHVLEHLPKPVDGLRQCHRLLSPGGKLVLSIPNLGSFEARRFGRAWMGLEVPRHLFHFREPVIRRLLGDNGFVVSSIRPAMCASSLSESLALVLPAAVRYRLLTSRLRRLLYFVTVFPASVSYLLGNWSTLEIVAEKPN